ASAPSRKRTPSGACAGGTSTSSAAPSPNRISAWPSSRTSTRVRSSAQAAVIQSGSSRRTLARSTSLRASTNPPRSPAISCASCSRTASLLPTPPATAPPVPGPSVIAPPAPAPSAVMLPSTKPPPSAPVQLRQLRPQICRRLRPLEQQRQLGLLVGGVDAVGVQADRHEHQRRAQDVGQVGLGAAASLPGEQHLAAERALHRALARLDRR